MTKKVLEQVRDTVRRYRMFPRGGLVLVAVSGGPDSMCLLDVLHRCRGKFGISLRVAHLNHLMRDQAPQDAAMVAEYARSLGIETTVAQTDVKELAREMGIGVEEAGREARYRFFENLMAEIGARHVALGHNLNDQAETVLMRVFRGSGSRGLSGIPPINRYIVRPLIEVPRDLIEEYCRENRIPTMTDAYNLDLSYTRNRIRYKTLPELAADYNPSLVDTLASIAASLRWDSEFLDETAAAAFDKYSCRLGRITVVDLKGLSSLKPAISSRVLDMAWHEVSGDDANLGLARTLELLDIPDTPVSLPGNVTAVREEGFLVLYPEAPKLPDVQLKVPGETSLPEIGITLTATLVDKPDEDTLRARRESKCANLGLNLEKEDVAFLDFNKCDTPLVVRSRREGDRFAPLGMSGREQKLQDFFTQNRVPRFYRDFVPLVVSGGKIAYVGGFRLDERFKVTESSQKVLRIDLRRSLRCRGNCVTI